MTSQQMRHLFVFLILTGLTVSCVFGDSPTKGAEGLPFGTWSIPLALVSRPDPLSPDGKRIPQLGFKIREGSDQLDATDFLRAMGVTFPPGSESIYSQEHGQLIVRNTAENLALIDRVLLKCDIGYLFPIPMAELSVLECELPPAKHPTARTAPTIQDLRNLPAEKIRIIDKVTAVTKSGNRTQAKHLNISATKTGKKSEEEEDDAPSDLFSEGEYGLVVEWEPVVGPDSQIIDNIVNFRWRGGPATENSREIAMETSFTASDGYPRILHTSSVPGAPGKYYVVTGLVRLTSPKSFTLEDLKAAVERVKAAKDSNKDVQSGTTAKVR